MLINLLKNILLLFTLSTTTLFANSQEQFAAANNAYQSGDYQKAIDHYKAILKTGDFSEALYYNLGNAYFKTNNLGKAILNYERALLVVPGNPDTEFNIAIARQKTEDDLDVIGNFFLTEWWKNTHTLFSSNAWGILTILSLWAGLGGIILWLFGTTRKRKKQGFVGGLCFLLLSFLLYFLANSQSNFEKNSHIAIVLDKKIELKNGPDKASTGILEIHEGLKITLLDQIGNWYKVKLSNGDQGWLPEGSFEEI